MSRNLMQRRRDAEKSLKLLVLTLFFVPVCPIVSSAQNVDRLKLTDQVKSEFLHAWNGYKKYCWGHDDLKPVSKTCRDWYGTPILMTPVDSLDSLYLDRFPAL